MGILKRNVPPKPGRPTVSIIARGNSLSGDIQITGKTHVDGHLFGHIKALEDMSIGKHGLLQGRIKGKKIFVSGSLEGEVICDHLFIEPGGKVHAQVCCADMKIDQGGLFVGERTLPEPLQGTDPMQPQHSSIDDQDLFDSLPERITLTGKS
ncbi:MAG: polymer-forming cytoskeletal protein [Nitrincola sp.]|nr:polymer-forming cytoskeletal protein [Nitrincola sp.]